MRNLLLLVLFVPFLLFSQKLSVSGKVMYNNEAITGVTVLEKGTFNGTTTDLDGNYSIKVNNDATLIFSFISFKSKELKVNKRQIINVTLEEDASKLDEVIIKGFTGVVGQARRRAESIQNIPESVVTYTSKAIETKGITNIKSFADQIPNVNFTSSQNVGNNFITVRGISHIRNGESPIAFVIDGVTLPDANLLNQELFDLALIEIVKGPQGALYGKNAIAGAINITTKQPTNKFSNKVSLGYGRGNMFKAQVSSTGPISKDKLFYRISGSYKKGDGLITNKTLNKTVDFIEDLTFRGQLKAKISTGFNATLTGQIIDAKGGAAYYAKPITGTNFAPDDFNNEEVLSDQFGESSLKGFYGNLKLNYLLCI